MGGSDEFLATKLSHRGGKAPVRSSADTRQRGDIET